jgi:hypothetical protein
MRAKGAYDDEQEGTRFGATLALPVNRYHSVKLFHHQVLWPHDLSLHPRFQPSRMIRPRSRSRSAAPGFLAPLL